MNLEKRWLAWQVFAPLFTPIIISALGVLAWRSGNPEFNPSMQIIVDISPWALTFYSLTLIGATLNDLWPRLLSYPELGLSLLFVAFGVALYATLIVIWRHNPTFVAGPQVYGVALGLLLVSVILCHAGYQRRGP